MDGRSPYRIVLLLLTALLSIIYCTNKHQNKSNLITIECSDYNIQKPQGHDTHSTESPRKTYSSDQLKSCRSFAKHDNRLKCLPFGVIRRIHQLRINKTHKSRRKQKTDKAATREVNISNLIHPYSESQSYVQYYKRNINCATINVCSLKRREQEVFDIIKDYNLDLVAVTETWL